MQKINGVLLESISRFGGGYPEVPIAPHIDKAKLLEGDDSPVFFTVPIGEVDTTSRNGRKYNREAIQSLVNKINKETSIGQQGHLRDEDRAYSFDIPPIIWVGASLETDGKAYGKAYVMQNAPAVREYVRVAKSTNAHIGTSIYGTADVDDGGNVTNLEIESIDLAHPARLGVEMAGAVPQITQETVTESDTQEDSTVPEENVVEVIPSPAVIVEMKRAHTEAVRELEGRIAELKGAETDLAAVATLAGADDPIMGVRMLLTRISNLSTENGELLKESIAAQVAEAVVVEKVRPIIVEMVTARKPTTRQAVKTAVAEVLDTPAVKALLKDTVAELAGPPQTRPATQSSNDSDVPPLIIIPVIPGQETS